jgi:hypothetical protein
MNLTDSSTTIIPLDIATILYAIVWSLIVIPPLHIHRKQTSAIIVWLGWHVKKVEFQHISLEPAETKNFSFEWAKPWSDIDLQRKARSIDVANSISDEVKREKDPISQHNIQLSTFSRGPIGIWTCKE